MHSRALQTSILDRLAIGLSSLCLVHCLGTAIFMGLVASAGGALGSPIIHQVGFALAMGLGAFALGKGLVEHGYAMPVTVGALGLGVMAGAETLPHDGGEVLWTMIGVGILALGHRLNAIAAE